MNEELESRLRSALRPSLPRKEFSEQLLARIATQAQPPPARAVSRALASRTTPWWLVAGLAASLLLALGVEHRRHEIEQRDRGLEARRQVIEALRVTNQKLDLAYRVVRGESLETPGEHTRT